jgi:hypothetical protein
VEFACKLLNFHIKISDFYVKISIQNIFALLYEIGCSKWQDSCTEEKVVQTKSRLRIVYIVRISVFSSSTGFQLPDATIQKHGFRGVGRLYSTRIYSR